ncbi:MAG: polysaccharide deacetylase family protein [Cellulosilyticaceae bacterium]
MNRNIKVNSKYIIVGLLSIFFLISTIGIYAKDRLLPIYSVKTDQKLVALTFDCAWGAEDIPNILSILEENQVKATFFVVGDWVRANPNEARMIAEAGHDIGNHSDGHPHVTQIEKEEIKKDIRLAHQIIQKVTGIDAQLYRPPYGEYNNSVIEAAEECQYYTVQWDVDSIDWKEYGKQAMIDKVLKHKNLSSGSIVLLHNGTKYTQHALDEIIKGLKQKGFSIVPVSEMILKQNYEIDHTGRQYRK